MGHARSASLRGPLIVDLCTGSGALAVALAQHRPPRGSSASMTPMRPSSTRAATPRAPRSSSSAPTSLSPGLLPELDGRVDLVVANPPYVPDGVAAGTRSRPT